MSIITRAYLVDPVATDRELRQMGLGGEASRLRIDYETGRLASVHADLTGKRVMVVPASPSPPTSIGGAFLSPAEDARE